jgi:hypothetical protein
MASQKIGRANQSPLNCELCCSWLSAQLRSGTTAHPLSVGIDHVALMFA